MPQKPRDTAKYQFVAENGRIIRSGVTRRALEVRERELRREEGRNGNIRQVGRRTTADGALDWERGQRKGTPPGGRRGK